MTLRVRDVVFVLSAIWVLMSLWNFDLPGLQMDEANHYAFSPGILRDRAAGLHHFRFPDNWFDMQDGRPRFPVIGGSLYNTDIGAYAGIPVFAYMGFSQASLRIYEAILALAAILSVATFVGRAFGWLPALLFGLVLVTDPTNVLSARSQGHYFWYVVLFASLGAHCLLTSYRDQAASVWWAAGAGAGISLAVLSYFVGAFLAAPMIVAGLCIFRGRPRRMAAFILAGALAYSPVIYAVVSIYVLSPRHLGTFGVPGFVLAVTIPTFSMENVAQVWALIRGSMASFDLARAIAGQFDVAGATARLFALGAALIAVVAAFVSRPPVGPAWRGIVAAAAVASVLFLAAAFFLKSMSVLHFIVFAVLIFILVSSLAGAGGLFRWISVAVCVALLATNVLSLLRAHKELRRTGGAGYHNEAYSMPASLFRTTLKDRYPVFASWGSHLQFLFQTGGRVPYSFIEVLTPAAVKEAIAAHEKTALIISKVDRASLGKVCGGVSEMNFSQRDGRPLFDIVLIDRASCH